MNRNAYLLQFPSLLDLLPRTVLVFISLILQHWPFTILLGGAMGTSIMELRLLLSLSVSYLYCIVCVSFCC
jgi:hypothetical protein